MKQLARAAALAAAVLSPVALAAGFAAPAAGVTAACASDPFCGGQTAISPNLALAVASDHPASTDHVVAAVPSASPRQDWDMRPPANPVNNDKVFRWAPNGVPSTGPALCLSDPFFGVRKPLQLRKCNGSPFQTWTPTHFTEDGAAVWVNNATGLAMTEPPGTVAGTPLQGRTVGAGTGTNKLWHFVPPPAA